MTIPVCCLTGPTASGKSHLALLLAKTFNVEIVSVDSALVYRHMNIGTAKPSIAERQIVRHHLIDIIDPIHRYSVAKFCIDATHAINDILSRGKIPLLVGGSMLYIKSLESGLAKLPSANYLLRTSLDEEANLFGWPAMHQKLKKIDPVSAAQITPFDSQRIQRALEVYWSSGVPISELVKKNQHPGTFQLIKLGLIPQERQWLKARINKRFGDMLQAGFLEEVKRIRQSYPTLTLALPATRTVGYRQAWQYLDGLINYEDFVRQTIITTHQLAKKQLTWLRKMKHLTELDCQKTDTIFLKASQWFSKIINI